MPLAKFMVIIDPTRNSQPAFERALESARLTGARLHLYTCLDNTCCKEDRGSLARAYQAMMDEQVLRAREDGVEAISEIDWSQDWRLQVPSAAARCSASLIFKNYLEHNNERSQMRLAEKLDTAETIALSGATD